MPSNAALRRPFTAMEVRHLPCTSVTFAIPKTGDNRNIAHLVEILAPQSRGTRGSCDPEAWPSRKTPMATLLPQCTGSHFDSYACHRRIRHHGERRGHVCIRRSEPDHGRNSRSRVQNSKFRKTGSRLWNHPQSGSVSVRARIRSRWLLALPQCALAHFGAFGLNHPA